MPCVRLVIAMLCVCVLLGAPEAAARQPFGPPSESMMTAAPADARAPGGSIGVLSPDDVEGLDLSNPISVLAGASRALPGASQSGEGDAAKGGLSTSINILVVLTVIWLVPTIMLLCTCFLRIVIVLGLLKQALGTQTMPPGQVLLGLSLIMTLLVMTPTLERINSEAIQPWKQGEIRDYETLWNRAKQPVRDFMFAQIEATGNWSSVYMILNYRGIDTSRPEQLTRADVDMVTLVPAFVLSELKVAFLMGFKVYLPFLVIDMVISTLLISMSMMMLPPVLISLPFKLLLFVLVDGWTLICGSLMQSFAAPAVTMVTGSG